MSGPAQACFKRLEEISGGPYVVTEEAALTARQVCGMRPSVVVRPADAAQVGEILRFASAEKLAVIPAGGGTKLGMGSPPARYDISLDLTRMNRVLSYDPQDLTLGVEPGVRIEDLLRTLAEQKQFLPLAVPFSDRATIAGIAATNSSSLLRHAYGAVRDFCLGMEFVTGEGKQAKSGGRVVKNVTGYDLHKLLIGSLGTLGVITRLNFRTFPLPATQGTFVASFLDAEGAFEFCRVIAQSVLTPQIVEAVDPVSARFVFSADAATGAHSQHWGVVISAAGHSTVVERYARELRGLASAASATEFAQLTDRESFVLARIREFPRLILEAAPESVIFRIGVLPTAMASLFHDLSEVAKRCGLDLATITRASGILYAALLPQAGSESPSSVTVSAVKEVFDVCTLPKNGAHAMIEFCPTEFKHSGFDAWGPWRQDFALMSRMKDVFDPQHVLSPGRFAGGI